MISFTLPLNCSIMRKCRRRVQNFLSEPVSSKPFWQLGCQVDELFPPLVSRVLEESVKCGLRKFHKKNFRMDLIAATRAEGGLVYFDFCLEASLFLRIQINKIFKVDIPMDATYKIIFIPAFNIT